MSHRRALVLGALAASLCLPSTAFGLDEVNSKKLRDAVTVNGILQHERALQAVANANGGTRASGTPGYEASLQYVKQRLVKAGYRVKEQEFTFPFFRELAPATVSQVSPTPKDYTVDTFEYSGSGDVTAKVQAVRGITIPPPAEPGTTPAGCTAADFAGFTAGNIALIQRGTCDFGLKASNAKAAGAVGVIIFNEGQEGRTGLPAGTLGEPIDIPVVGMTFADGSALYQQLQGGATVTLHITTSTEADLDAKTKNLIADTKTGNADETVVVGGHLDSVVEGPGHQRQRLRHRRDPRDRRGHGEQKIKPRRAVRFAFWGAEESGLLGSEHYVTTLPGERPDQDLREPELRHGRVAELRPLRLRRRRL